MKFEKDYLTDIVKGTMKKSLFFLLLNLYALVSFGQKDQTITEIKEHFQKWQSIITEEYKSSNQLFQYALGEKYQEEKWSDTILTPENKFLITKATVIEKPAIGTFVNYDHYSMSGDWKISVDYYFNKRDSLYFVFWRMNTFQADEPLTIEKRLYFNDAGSLIKNLQSVYKINSKEESTAAFADRKVVYEISLNEMGFYPEWKKE